MKKELEKLKQTLLNSQREDQEEAQEAERRLRELEEEQARLEEDRKNVLNEFLMQKTRPKQNLSDLEDSDDTDSEEEDLDIKVARPRSQKITTLANAGRFGSVTTDIAQLNPWLVEFRNRLLKAQEEAAQDDKKLRDQLEQYELVIQDLRDTLSKSTKDADAQREAQINALQAQLDEENAQVQDLIKKLDDKTSEASTYKNQWLAAAGELEDSKGELKGLKDKLSASEAAVARLTVEVEIAKSEFAEMEAETKRLSVRTTQEREALQGQIEDALRELEEKKSSLEAAKQEAENAATAFENELDRNKQLLEDMKTRRDTLEKEVFSLKMLQQKDFDTPQQVSDLI